MVFIMMPFLHIFTSLRKTWQRTFFQEVCQTEIRDLTGIRKLHSYYEVVGSVLSHTALRTWKEKRKRKQKALGTLKECLKISIQKYYWKSLCCGYLYNDLGLGKILV